MKNTRRLSHQHKNFFLSFFSRFAIFTISKRQRFLLSVTVLTIGLFFSEYLFGKSGVYIAIFLAIVTNVLLLLSNYKDIKGNISSPMFLLPFLYTLSFGLFYFLVPSRHLSRIALTSLYGVGLYAVFLSHNIFTIASMKTIALLSSARTVSFVMAMITYFFLANIVFTLDLGLLPTSLLVFLFSFFLARHAVWIYTLEKPFFSQGVWVFSLAICLSEISLLLWLWPSSPTVVALFLTGLFYAIVGLSHVWLDKRLFRNVLWEYIWVVVAVLCILLLFTTWRS